MGNNRKVEKTLQKEVSVKNKNKVEKKVQKEAIPKNKKKVLLFLILLMIIILMGIASAIFEANIIGGNKVAISGDIWMKFNGSDVINLTNIIPMTKDEALEKTDNIFNFQISGKNTSDENIYYGISL